MVSSEVSNLVLASQTYDGESPSQELIDVSRAFLAHAVENPIALNEASECLPTLPYNSAAWLALMCGNAIESSGDASLSLPGLWSLFLSWIQKLPAIDASSQASQDPPMAQAELQHALTSLCQAIVSHLARAPDFRRAVSTDHECMATLEALPGGHIGVDWVLEALRRTSGTVVALDTAQCAGYRVHYENISTCFHLFTLLQVALAERGVTTKSPNPAALRAATGQAESNVHDAAWWHYGSPLSPSPNLMGSIWGEASALSIPTVRGVQVILLWPPILGGRSWDSNFFGPYLEALPADLQIERTLTTDECLAWFEVLGVERGAPAPVGAPLAQTPSQSSERRWWDIFRRNG